MKKVLVSGGAGYIGSVLVRQLLGEGYFVRVIDLLNFSGEAIVELLSHPHFEFQKGDIRNRADLEKALEGIHYIAHLASIVGDPACAKDPELTKSTNLEGSKLFYEVADEMGIEKFVFASTCSNYGKMDDPTQFVHEDSELRRFTLCRDKGRSRRVSFGARKNSKVQANLPALLNSLWNGTSSTF